MTQVLLSEEINKYAEEHTTEESDVLKKLNRETHLKIALPVMLSGHLQGAVLEMMSHMIKPERVLEIGTYTGYSAICMAKGMAANGHLHTIDINEELEDMCFRYFCEAGFEKQITQHIGVAAEILPTINEKFDMVFIDADKVNYALYYDLVFDSVKVGGYILADNVLYEGQVVLEGKDQSKNAKALHAFNNKVCNDESVEQVLLPIRDGIMVARKIK